MPRYESDRRLCSGEIKTVEVGFGSVHDRPHAEFTAAEQPLKVGHSEAAPRHRVDPTPNSRLVGTRAVTRRRVLPDTLEPVMY